jgi:3-oxoacyl-[acyl-carrier protein] reductase
MNKTVLVTGAAKGIGKQIVEDFLNEGYNVCLNYNTSKTQAEEIQKKTLQHSKNLIIYKADVSNRTQVEEMVDYVIQYFGKIDVLVNNAGISKYDLFTDIKEDEFKEMIDTTIIGTFNTTQEVLKKSMISNKSGSIINISSIWGITGASCEVHYSTVKAGIIGMTKALAKELGPSNIRVNAVAPGVIETDMIKDFNEDEINELRKQIPLNKIGTPKDVSGVVKFLASDESKYITGQVISPNGGMVI